MSLRVEIKAYEQDSGSQIPRYDDNKQAVKKRE